MASLEMELDSAEENLSDEILNMSTADIQARTRLLDNEIRIMRSELGRLQHELQAQNETIKENEKKIKQNKTLPYLVSNIIEVLDVNPEDEEEIEGANVDLDSQRKGKSVVIKTTTRQTVRVQPSVWKYFHFLSLAVFPPRGRPGGAGEAEARRPGGRQQGLLPDPGHPALRVRQPGEGDGGGHAAHRAVLGHRGAGQADPGAHRGRRPTHDTQGEVGLGLLTILTDNVTNKI